MKLSKTEFIEKLKEKYGEPFEILEYNGMSKPGIYYCGYCKKEYSFYKMGKLLSEKRKHICTHCWNSSYTKEILDMFPNNEFEFIKIGYKENLHKPTIIYKCLKCNQEIEKPFVEFLKYPTCIYCRENSKRRNTIGLIYQLPKDIIPLEEYKGKEEKILFKHSCGFIFKTKPAYIINGKTSCPKCNRKISKGERKIMNFLDSNNIIYEKEKKFDWADLKRYDFYLKDYNLIIEYNGMQHYIDRGFFKLSVSEQQKIDNLKEKLAIEHKIDYLVIPYTDFDNIESILAQRLSLTGVGLSVDNSKRNAPYLNMGEDIV